MVPRYILQGTFEKIHLQSFLRQHALQLAHLLERTDVLAVLHPLQRHQWNALGYLLTRFFTPTRSLFPGWVSLPRMSHFTGSVHRKKPKENLKSFR